jgi:hypothetical protein
MDRKLIPFAVVIVCAVLCVATVVTATSRTDTPLYTVRMEQASSKMNFLPTAVTTFTYTSEQGYTVDHDVSGGYCGIGPLHTGYNTCQNTCPETCEPGTCDQTCPFTCWNTCEETCPSTCTETCPYTCDDFTCSSTCEETCPNTCNTCWNTCWYTCLTCKVCPPTEGPEC